MDIDKIIKRCGGHDAVGRMCGITRQAIYQWDEVPPRFVLVIARQSTLTPHDMRPDLYPHPLDGTRVKPKVEKRIVRPSR